MHPGRLQRVVRQQRLHLKEVIAVGTVEVAGQHATVLETGDPIRTGTGRSGQVSRGALCSRSRRDDRV